MSVVVIVNPVAGGRRRSPAPDERVALVERALARHGLSGRVELTRAAGHGRELARLAVAEGCALVVAWGGDGTINEVASQLVGTGAVLGIVRAGSGNGLARELGIPARAEDALGIALAGRERPIDVGEIEGHTFLNIAGIGFDAAMAAEFNRLGTERRGSLRYAVRAVRAAVGYQACRYVVEVDDQRLEVNAAVVAIANFGQYGSNVVVAPHARSDDGLFDVVVVEDRGTAGRIGLVPRVFDRTIDKAVGVTTLRGARVKVTSATPILFQVDGEPHPGGLIVEARLHPAALRVKVP
jgi:YegS/Rv2252/BmrU family lipid kinase